MKVALINANLVTREGDILGSGIPYLPIGLAYLAAVLRQRGHQVHVLDAFGAAPFRLWQSGNYLLQGLTPEEIEKHLPEVEVAFIYAWSVMSHYSVKAIGRRLKKLRPALITVVTENPNAVTGYSIKECLPELLDGTFDIAIIGDAEGIANDLLEQLEKGHFRDELPGVAWASPDGIKYGNDKAEIENLDRLPFPAWELFPIEKYWRLGYGHGPVCGRYLPLLSSRGCPHNCRFCTIPVTAGRSWRIRSAQSVVAEMLWAKENWGVTEFHFEDVNPGSRASRMVELSNAILAGNLKVTWKLVSGTKIDNWSAETLDLIYRAGCRYLSFSPETGSPRLLEAMNKDFDYDRAVKLTRRMKQLRLRSQACFVLGFPGESEADRQKTSDYVRTLVRAGLDEIALFIMAPMPGTPVFEQYQGYDGLSDLSFSPYWREDYSRLAAFRNKLYRQFFFWLLLYNPVAVLRVLIALLRRRFDTKMAMTFYRAWKIRLMLRHKKEIALHAG